MTSEEQNLLTCGEALAVCKVLLESRSMKKSEMKTILDKLLDSCVLPEDRQAVNRIISNERLYYIEPHHGKSLTEQLWTISQAIQTQSVLQVRYLTQAGQEKQRMLHPVGLMFSEFYFYLTAFIENIDRAEHFEDPNDLSPTIYRVDRLPTAEILGERDGTYEIRAEVFGKGIDMWPRSQGSFISKIG